MCRWREGEGVEKEEENEIKKIKCIGGEHVEVEYRLGDGNLQIIYLQLMKIGVWDTHISLRHV